MLFLIPAGLGDNVKPSYLFGFEVPGQFFIFDMSIFIIINIIGLNVILGIIVDTFSNLREEKRSKFEVCEMLMKLKPLKDKY